MTRIESRATWALVALAWLGLQCGSPPTKIGNDCQTDAHCGGQESQLTLTCDHTIPGGSCTVDSCTPDDPATVKVDESDGCPDGARCVTEKDDRNVCRRACERSVDCGEVVLCAEACASEGSGCKTECKNRMLCLPFRAKQSQETDEEYEKIPRTCLVEGARKS